MKKIFLMLAAVLCMGALMVSVTACNKGGGSETPAAPAENTSEETTGGDQSGEETKKEEKKEKKGPTHSLEIRPEGGGTIMVDGDSIDTASAKKYDDDWWAVEIKMNKTGKKSLTSYSKKNEGKTMEILVDNSKVGTFELKKSTDTLVIPIFESNSKADDFAKTVRLCKRS